LRSWGGQDRALCLSVADSLSGMGSSGDKGLPSQIWEIFYTFYAGGNVEGNLIQVSDVL